MGKIRLKLKVTKNHPKQGGLTYKLKILGHKATISKFAKLGLAPNFSNDIELLLQSN